MYQPPLDPSIIIGCWRDRPPTGQQMQRILTSLLPPDAMEALLAKEMSRSVVYIRWCLGSKAVVPARLLAAAPRVSAGVRQIAPLSGSAR